MRIVKRILTGVFVTALAFGATAQSSDVKKKEHAQQMKKELGLSAEQETSMKAIKDKYHPQIKAIKENTSLTKEQKQAKIKPLKESKQAEIKSVLTPDQYTKFQELKKNKPHAKHKDKVLDKLDLTDDQQSKMKALNQEYHPKMKAIRTNASLADTEKKKQIKALKKNKDSEIGKILTPEQLKKYKELKKQQRKTKKK